MDALIKRSRTLTALKRILLHASLVQPLVVVFEDLHWIDEGSQEFLDLIADGIASARILLLVNYRPEYSHEWSSKSYYIRLGLDPLGKESADEMLTALVGDGRDLRQLKRLVVQKTGGNPFFMEEMVQSLFEQRVLERKDGVNLMQPLTELKIPPTVQGILASRIDRLPAEEKELLQILAVIGKEFPLTLIKRLVNPLQPGTESSSFAREADKARRMAMFTQRLERMKIFLEGSRLPPPPR